MVEAGDRPSFSKFGGGGGSFAGTGRGPIAVGVVPFVPGLPEWSERLNDQVNEFIEKSYGTWLFGRSGRLVRRGNPHPWEPNR